MFYEKHKKTNFGKNPYSIFNISQKYHKIHMNQLNHDKY